MMDAPHEILDTRNCHNLKGDIYIYICFQGPSVLVSTREISGGSSRGILV